MQHEFVYPIVRPLPPRGTDAGPAAWLPVDDAVRASAADTALARGSSHAAADGRIGDIGRPGHLPR
jgi:hypothetical protein